MHARRLVAQQCLYGVDKSAAAVELAKLSLWLVTLSRTLPFTFVDHALRHGDSLVGLDFKQIEAFHWAPPGQVGTIRVLLHDALDQAVELRQQILALADHEDPVAQAEKRRLFEFSQQAIERVRLVADACVGAFFAEAKDAARDVERKRRLALVEGWLGLERRAAEETRTEEERVADLAASMAAREELEPLAAEARDKLAPFHWWIEFPEVFFEKRPDPLENGRVNSAADMDACVGNPPFLGGSKVSGALGINYRDWLKAAHPTAEGRGDLSAHFFWRAYRLLGSHGAAGLIATNSIAQGDTRDTGLATIVRSGGVIYDATSTLYWPGEANVAVAIVYFAVGTPTLTSDLRRILDGQEVRVINSLLRAKPEKFNPISLKANEGSCYRGHMINGAGLLLSPNERDAFILMRQSNDNVIFPYLGGEEINTEPSQVFHRYVINFGKRSLADVSEWPELLERVRTLVKPARDAVRDNTGKGGHGKKYWWQFLDRCDPLHAALEPRTRCLVAANVTKHLAFAWQPLDRVLSNTVFVFALDRATQFVCLQSRIHEFWARLLSSSMRTDLRYAATECFETFPFPKPDPRTVIPELESIGERLYAARARFMVDTNQGLTKTYNALKDPACDDPRIRELRRLHEEMDRAVLAAYGWSDITMPSYCPQSDRDREALQAFEDEVIDRLYILNAERAREEQRLGLGGKKRARSTADNGDAADDAPTEAPPPKATGKGKKPSKRQEKLF